jgi:GTP-binding protein
MPGLIEGAHKGAGLGIKFLRHAERTRIFVHMIDISDDDPAGALRRYEVIRGELKSFDPGLIKRKEIVVFNKVDALADRKAAGRMAGRFRKRGLDVCAISAVTGEGVEELLGMIVKKLKEC